MTDYRAIVEHVRYWRGAIHHWSTSYSFTGSPTAPIDTAACQTLLTADSKMLYPAAAASQGNAYRCAIYLASGGTPIASYTAFDPTAPGAWTNPPTGGAWGSNTGNPDPQAEVALLVEWPAGLSAKGKPVTFKKYFHQVPPSGSVGGSVDILAGNVTAIKTAATNLGLCLNTGYGLVMGNSHRLAGTPVVKQYYANHQMPRGRRRRTSATSAARFGETVLRLAENEAYSNADA